jgi:hypothetical protein
MMVRLMKFVEAIPVLNRLLQTLCGSLPMYLAGAKPWTQSDHSSLQSAFDNLVADQQHYAQRVAEAISELGGQMEPIHFPTEYTAKNDLSLDFLLQEIIDALQQDMASVEYCVAELNGSPSLHSLAEEIYGNTRGHLENMQEIAKGR